MDALLLDLNNVSEQLLPILGAVALIFLCILLKKAWKLIEKLTETVNSLDPTIKLVNQSIDKAQAPLDTAVKLSHTIDDVRDKTVDSISKATGYAAENMTTVVDMIKDKVKPTDDSDVTVVDTYPKAPGNTQNKEENVNE